MRWTLSIGWLAAILSFTAWASAGQEPDEQALWAAAAEGDVGAIATILEGGQDVNALDPGQGWPALAVASRMGQAAAVKALLAAGADPNVMARDAGAPIALAAAGGHIEIVRDLLDAGANIDAAEPGHANALYWALGQDHTQIARFLIESGADVTHRGPAGHTALHLAVEKGDLEMARLLLERGAPVNAFAEERNEEGKHRFTPLIKAADAGSPPMIELLLSFGAGVDRQGRQELAVLAGVEGVDLDRLPGGEPKVSLTELTHAAEHAAKAGHLEIAKRLMEVLRRGDRHDVDGPVVRRSALARAAAAGDVDQIRALLAAADDLPMEELALALKVAEQEGRIESAALLRPVARSRALAVVTRLRLDDALEDAAREGSYGRDTESHHARAMVLLSRGADPNCRSEHTRQTPLMYAAQAGSVRLAKALLDAGADVNLRDAQGNTALAHAATKGHAQMIELLLARGADPGALDGGRALAFAANDADPAGLKALLELGADPNGTSYGGRTALIEAAEAGRIEAVKLLIDAGADVNAETLEGYTALMFAENEFHEEIASMLRHAGAEERSGGPGELYSPLFGPIGRGDLERVRDLLARGVDPARGKYIDDSPFGNTPLGWALNMRQWAIAELLVDELAKRGTRRCASWCSSPR